MLWGLNNIYLSIISLTPTSHIQYLKIDNMSQSQIRMVDYLIPSLQLSLSLSHTHTESFRVSLDPNLSVSHRVIEKHFEAFCKSNSTAGRGPEFSFHHIWGHPLAKGYLKKKQPSPNLGKISLLSLFGNWKIETAEKDGNTTTMNTDLAQNCKCYVSSLWKTCFSKKWGGG